MTLAVRPLRPGDLEGCLKVIGSLPRFFAVADNVRRFTHDVDSQGGLVTAGPGGDIVGFVTWKRHADVSAEITWMAVHATLRRRGIGSTLLHRLESVLASQGIRQLSLLTSASSHTYAPTRAFWQAQGYRPILQLDDLWETDVALVYTKALPR